MDNERLEAWVRELEGVDLPLLSSTPSLLTAVAEDETLSMRAVGRLVQRDPGLSLRLIRAANQIPHRHFRNPVVSLDEAVMMLGLRRVMERVREQPRVDQVLPPAAAERYRFLAARCAFAGLLAEGWGELRHDMIPPEVGLAGLLYGLGELLFAVHDERRIARYLDLVRRSDVYPNEAEYVALDVSLEAVGHRLALRWELPAMVQECTCPANARHPRALGVMLAAELARDALEGWTRAEAGIRLQQAAAYLECGPEELIGQINVATEDFNRYAELYAMDPLGGLDPESPPASVCAVLPPGLCLAPRRDCLERARQRLAAGTLEDRDAVLDTLLDGLHRGLGLNRVVFARLDENGERLEAERVEGADHEPEFDRFQVDLNGGHLVSVVMQRPSAFWLHDGNREDIWPRVPEGLRHLIRVRGFLMHSVFAGERAEGLVYADRRSLDCALDAPTAGEFKALVALAARELTRLAGRAAG
ncbi:HDOD domain-containing protein [Ectothiorhodospira mobilis]|uniref:HDOD domain-containing protein n=1 Tax=Ectothiorhodospira mobilis TaxID=195064 RepID=UPI00190876D0|nr:HDOD domain-containing protein [Ectothiorhodospira mobilis]